MSDYLLASLGALMLVAFIPEFILERRTWRLYLLVFFTPLFGLTASFGFGALVARSVIKSAERTCHIRLNSGRDIAGTLIRSGDKGILLYEKESKHFILVAWSQIASVENEQPPAEK